MKTAILSFCLVACLSLVAIPAASAQVLMLNFGQAPSGSNTVTTGSPYHTVASPGFTDDHWNTIGTSDVSSGLLFSNGTTAATGVSVNLGSAVGSTIINLGTNPNTVSALGTATYQGIYLNNNIAKSGVFQTGTDTRVGVQIGGLAIGTYDLYITARNTNTGQALTNGYTQTIYAGVGNSAGNFTYTDYSENSGSLVYGNNQNGNTYRTANWEEGLNYIKLTVSITSLDQYLNLAVEGINSGGSGDTRGFLNSIQIVQTSTIPEPAAYAALGGLATLGLAALRRRRA